MTNYMIEPSKYGDGFDISIINPNGSRQTILGFESIEDAETWIAGDKAMCAYNPNVPSKDSE